MKLFGKFSKFGEDHDGCLIVSSNLKCKGKNRQDLIWVWPICLIISISYFFGKKSLPPKVEIKSVARENRYESDNNFVSLFTLNKHYLFFLGEFSIIQSFTTRCPQSSHLPCVGKSLNISINSNRRETKTSMLTKNLSVW